MKERFYEVVSIILIMTSLYFFYYCIRFLAGRDYIAGILSILAGFSIIRAGLELLKVTAQRGE